MRQNTRVIDLVRRLVQRYEELGWVAKLALAAGLPMLTFVLGLVVVIALPSDHFVRAPRRDRFWQRHGLLRATVHVVRNGLGMVLVPLGVLMALPLVPGPGLVFILIGVSLLDLPGKRRLERRLLAYPRILHAVNHMRRWFSRPPVMMPPGAAHTGEGAS